MSGSNDVRTDGQTPAEAGKELADPETMSDSQSQQSGAQGGKIGQVVNGFENLYPRMTGHVWATVVSTRGDGNPTAYRVNLQDLTCHGPDGDTCPDMKHNVEGAEVCDHIATAIYQAPRQPQLDALAIDGLVDIMDMAQEAADAAHNTAKVMERAQATAATQAAAETDTETDDRPSLEETTPDPDVDPQEAADELQAAYDDVVDDMQVQAANGLVWVQTGRDTPDTLPGPGNVEVFDAFLSGPDAVEYVHDDHSLVDDKPGEWWKNAIKPSDVSGYIEEVLE
jgi:hypothetical protein